MKTFSESQNPSFLAKNMGHHLECFGTLLDMFHTNRFFFFFGTISGTIFFVSGHFFASFCPKSLCFFASGEAFSCLNFVRFLPTPRLMHACISADVIFAN